MDISDWQRRATVSVREAAAILGIGRASAYEAVRSGQLPHLLIGRRILVPTGALTRLLETAWTADMDESR